MAKFEQKQCPGCGQQLRIPKNIGGMLMECPTCGTKLYTDFRIGKGAKPKGTLLQIFEMPTTLLERLHRFLFRR